MPGSPIRRPGRPLWTPAFASVAYALFVVLLGSNLPTPLWNLYQARYGLTASGVTEVFVAYTLSLLVMLLIGGWVSDRLGRRPIMLPAVTAAMAGGAVFLGARGPQWLLAGRALAGLAAGGLIVAGTAALTELAPAGGRARASVVASSATVAGLAAGPLLTGLLAQYAPYPDRLVFAIYVLVTLPALPALALTYRPDPAEAAAPGRARLQRGDCKQLAVSAGGFAPGWALLGVFLAFGPAFTTRATGDRDDAVAGSIVCLVFVVSAAAQGIARAWRSRAQVPTGLAVLVAGAALLAWTLAARAGALPLVLACLAIGAGQGISFQAAQRELVQGLDPDVRGRALSLFFVSGYVLLAAVVLSLGAVTDAVGLVGATQLLAVTVGVLALGSMLLGTGPERGLTSTILHVASCTPWRRSTRARRRT